METIDVKSEKALKRFMKYKKEDIIKLHLSRMNTLTSISNTTNITSSIKSPLIHVISPSQTQVDHKSDNENEAHEDEKVFIPVNKSLFSGLGDLNKLYISDGEDDENNGTIKGFKSYTSTSGSDEETIRSARKYCSKFPENSKKCDELKDLENMIVGLNNQGMFAEKLEPSIHGMYERIILELKAEILSLRKSVEIVESSLRDQIDFLKDQLKTKDKFHELLLNFKIQSLNGFNIVDQDSVIKTSTTKTNDNTTLNVKTKKGVIKQDSLNKSPDYDFYEIIGDSHLNNVNEKGLSNKNRKVNIRRWSGASSEDILDLIKPAIRNKPKEIIIHTGYNDLSNAINPLNNIKKIAKLVKEDAPNTKLTFSGIMIRQDRKIITDKSIKDVNDRLQNYCVNNELGYIDNSNIDASFLGKKRLHMSKRGTGLLAKNFINHLNQA